MSVIHFLASSRLMSTTYIWNQTPPRIPSHSHMSFSTGNSGKGDAEEVIPLSVCEHKL